MGSTHLVPKYRLDTLDNFRSQLLDEPFGFYVFLGVPRHATPEDIKTAYRRLAKQLHPDKGGSTEDFTALNKVISILLDDGGKLGHQHSERLHYDLSSGLGEYFDRSIEYEGERTIKISEIILSRMQDQKISAEMKLRMGKNSPEFDELLEKLKQTASEEEKEKIRKRIIEILGFEHVTSRNVKNLLKFLEERSKYRKAKFDNFYRSLKENPSLYTQKILDIFYAGGDEITFWPLPILNMKLGDYEDKKHILKLLVAGNCYITNFSRVHFKAEQANVNIEDPNLEGIFHVINGYVSVSFDGTSYNRVIRARAPIVDADGFSQKGNFFIPSRFAEGKWWLKRPTLDIAVKEGVIDLKLESQIVSSRNIYDRFYPTILDELDKILYGGDKKDCNNIHYF